MNLFTKQKQTDIENKLMVNKGKGGSRDKLGVWDYIYPLLYTKLISNKDLLQQGNSVQYSLITCIGKILKKNKNSYMYN